MKITSPLNTRLFSHSADGFARREWTLFRCICYPSKGTVSVAYCILLGASGDSLTPSCTARMARNISSRDMTHPPLSLSLFLRSRNKIPRDIYFDGLLLIPLKTSVFLSLLRGPLIPPLHPPLPELPSTLTYKLRRRLRIS